MLNTRQLQKIELSMLETLSDLLTDNNIPFFLAYGSALGAVRDHGFIPWDDDVDIYIFGRDYEKFRQLFLSANTGNLVLHDWSTVDDYPYSFPKIVSNETVLVENSLKHLTYESGVYIDVFLLSEVSSNKLLLSIQEFHRYLLYALLRAYYFQFDGLICRSISFLVRHLFNPRHIQKSLYRLYTQKSSGDYLLSDSGTFGKQAIWEPCLFQEKLMVPFGSILLPVPLDFDFYLTKCYGQYMSLPPIEDRVSHHDFYIAEACNKYKCHD